MKHIHICSIVELRHLLGNHQIPPKSYALISSNSELDIPVPIPFSFECYDDIDLDCHGRVFSVEAANRFAKAIKENGNSQHYWCICNGGGRRSAAVAASILRFWDCRQKELSLIWNDPQKEPNIWVYQLMCRALDVPVDDVDLDLLIYTNRLAIRNAFRNKPNE